MFETLTSPKRILLVEPPYFKIFGYKRWHYPIGLTLIATYLKEQGHDVIVYDADRPTSDCVEYSRSEAGKNYHRYSDALDNLEHPVWKEVISFIKNCKPDIVGISASVSAKIESADIIAKMIKELYGNKVITVLGGVHVDSMLGMYPDYDFGKYYDFVPRNVHSLIEIKPDKKLLVDYDKYSPQNFCSIMTSMGCPNACTFCCYSTDRRIRYRSVESIREELIELKQNFGVSNTVYFIDDNFIANTKRFIEITDIIKELGMKFKAGGRVMDLTEEKIAKFIQNGGERIYVGVESGSQRIRDLIKKRLKESELIKRTGWLHEAGIPWSAFYMVGFPFETLDDLKMTKESILKIQPTFVSINRFMPYPGTDIFKQYYLDADIKFRDLFQTNLKPGVLLSDEIEDYISELIEFVDEYNKSKLL